MRLLRILLTGLCAAIAVVAGLFIAAVGLLAFGIGRLLGRPRSATPTAAAKRRPSASGDVIDVTATEVRSRDLPPETTPR